MIQTLKSRPLTKVRKSPAKSPEAYRARTRLGKKLMAMRKRVAASGQPLLDWDEIRREVADRRGEANEQLR